MHFVANEYVPCKNCGSSEIKGGLVAHEAKTVHIQIRVKVKVPGVAKPILDMRQGTELHRDTNTLRYVSRIIYRVRNRLDRARDRYTEQIDDKDGNVVRKVDEPLSDHRGRGSAKDKK